MRMYLSFTDVKTCKLVLEEDNGEVFGVITNITSWNLLGVALSSLIINSHLTFSDSVLFLKKCSEENVILSNGVEDSGFPEDNLQIRFVEKGLYKSLILEGVKSGKDIYWELSPLYTWTHVEFVLSHFVFGQYMDLREAHSILEVEKLNDSSFPQYPEDMSEEAKKDMEYNKILDEFNTEGDPNWKNPVILTGFIL